MGEGRTGGCGCDAIRYRLASAPFDAGWCHCRICQRASGSPALAFATVPLGDFVIERGADRIGIFLSSSFGVRQFCVACGTPLTMQVTHQPGTIDVTVATLDDPADVVPGFHIFHAAAIAWAETADTLPRHAGFRPDTLGLEGGKQP